MYNNKNNHLKSSCNQLQKKGKRGDRKVLEKEQEEWKNKNIKLMKSENQEPVRNLSRQSLRLDQTFT